MKDQADPSQGRQVQDLHSLLLLLSLLLDCMGTEGFKELFLLAALQENKGSKGMTMALCVCLPALFQQVSLQLTPEGGALGYPQGSFLSLPLL